MKAWQWLLAWWRQIAGPPAYDPWEDDARIRAERPGQHERMNRAQRYLLERQLRERRVQEIEAAWRRGDAP